MKIRWISETLSTVKPHGCFQRKKIYDVPDEEGQEYVAKGLAVKVDEPPAEKQTSAGS
jgi:hypothetical protein